MSKQGENIYLRSDGRYEGRYPMGRKENGRIRYGYVYGSQYEQVSREVNKRKIFSQRDPGPGPEFGQWAADWLREQGKGQMKRSTLQTYSGLLRRYLLPSLEGIPLRGITAEMVQTIVDEMEELGYAPATIRASLRLLSAMLRDARRAGLKVCDLEGVSWRGGRTTAEQRVLSSAEQQRIVREAVDDADVPVLVALFTGMRLGEICALKWRDIDWERAVLTVRRTAQRLRRLEDGAESQTALSVDAPKSARSLRTLPLPGPLLERLRALMEHSEGEGEYVFSRNGQPMEPRTAQRRFHALMERAGISDVHFHTLRHSFATQMLELGVDIKTVSVLLGHSSVRTTLEFYAHSRMEHQRRAMDDLADSITNPPRQPSKRGKKSTSR